MSKQDTAKIRQTTNFVCSDCGFAFRSKQELKGHVIRKHSNVKRSIPCELCGKLFRHMSNLKSHFNIHKQQSEREHRCNDCNVTFKSETTLKSHMILHDPRLYMLGFLDC